MKNINFNKVTIKDQLFTNRIETISEESILEAIKKCYDTPRVNNFLEAKKAIAGQQANFEGIVYDDADIYKILEGASYILSQKANEKLEYELNKLIGIISEAQEPSGYLTTKHTIHPEMKWICLDAHEMYNMGHLIEAAVAHYLYSNKKTFLNVGIKAADYLVEKFGKKQTKWVPGHQEIELALLKLYNVTGNYSYVELCTILLESRGKGYGWPNHEYKDKAVFIPNQETSWNKEYHQDSEPLEHISKVEGHAVRAMYMYTAMAELGAYNENKYLPALERVWENLVQKNMYITGGIGSTKVNEGFTEDYDLPNDTAYCETCASVGMVFWNSKMYEITKDVKYLDIIEKELKNGALSGLSLDGKSYFYDNPLCSHGTVQRQEWFETSCCPTQLMRFIPQIANYIFYLENKVITIAQPITSEITLETGKLELFVGENQITITNNTGELVAVNLRQPLGTTFKNTHAFENGLLPLQIKANEKITIETESNVIVTKSNYKVCANRGKSAIEYKGFVYCAEEIDNGHDCTIAKDYSVVVQNCIINNLLVEKIILESYDNKKLKLVPYFTWNNRGNGEMNVWIDDLNEKLYH